MQVSVVASCRTAVPLLSAVVANKDQTAPAKEAIPTVLALPIGIDATDQRREFDSLGIANYLHSALIMADMSEHFREFMIEGTQLNESKLKDNIARSVMMVTALSPVIGYDKASAISHYAIDKDLTLKEAALANGVSEELFDKVVVPINMTRPGSADVS